MNAAEVNLTVTGSVESLHLEPGDRVIVTIDGNPAVSNVGQIVDALTAEFAPHKVIVLNGLRIAKQAAA